MARHALVPAWAQYIQADLEGVEMLDDHDLDDDSYDQMLEEALIKRRIYALMDDDGLGYYEARRKVLGDSDDDNE